MSSICTDIMFYLLQGEACGGLPSCSPHLCPYSPITTGGAAFAAFFLAATPDAHENLDQTEDPDDDSACEGGAGVDVAGGRPLPASRPVGTGDPENLGGVAVTPLATPPTIRRRRK